MKRSVLLVLAIVLALGGCAERPPPARSVLSSHSVSGSPTTPFSAADWARARGLVRRMSLADRAGQVLVPAVSDRGSPAPLVRRLHLGGVITLPDSPISPATARRVNLDVTRAVQRRGYPPFIGIDQEGGSVVRLTSPATTFPAFMAAGAADEPALTQRVAAASAAELKRLGFTAVFAPDADVTIGADDPAIGSRSAGERPRLVARQVLAAMDGIESEGVIPVLKHFPGHGSVTTDSHLGLPVQSASLAHLLDRDLIPFGRAISAGAPAIMTAHIEVSAFDSHNPASASHAVTTTLLRRGLGFRGLVVTDALNMAGIQRVYPGASASVHALAAGADVLLMPPDPAAARAAIVRAVQTHRLPVARLDEAATRMIATLLHAGTDPATGAPIGSGFSAARALARAAITTVSGGCRGDLLPPEIRVSGPPSATAAFSSLVRGHGVSVVPLPPRRVIKKVVWHTVRVKHRVRGKRKPVVRVQRVRRVVKRLGDFVRPPAPLVALIGYGAPVPPVSDVLVALDRPTDLGYGSARVKVATFGSGYVDLSALADVLTGHARAPGRLPVQVPGVPSRGC